VQNATNTVTGETGDHKLDFGDAFFSSLIMIILSELGDKTFFIAAVSAIFLLS